MLHMTIPYLLERAARKYPDREAVVSETGRLTYRQWLKNSDRLAWALHTIGVKKGDRVTTLFLNGRTVLELYLALLKLGAVLVPLNMRLTAEEPSHIVKNSDASVFIYEHQFRPIVDTVRRNTPRVNQWVVSGGEPDSEEASLEALQGHNQEGFAWPDLLENDAACIMYTAGTTGKPKGVVHSHRTCTWAAAAAAAEVDLAPDYRVALVFPLFHVAAFALLVTNLYLGCTTVTVAKFDPAKLMETVQRARINRLVFPPTVWNFILQLPDLNRYDTSSVRSLGSGAEPMLAHTKRRLMEVFPNAKLGETYGMTETMAVISTLKPSDVLEKTDSVGKPFHCVEVRIVDEQGCDLPAGHIGEILVRGPNVTAGYYQNPQATKEAFTDGWLHTGDLGETDEDGFLYIRDRKKDMIISGGENIYPREIEEVLATHPKVQEVAVVGAPDPVWGQQVHATVVLRPDVVCAQEEIILHCRNKLAGFKRPRSVTFVAALPRSPAGKVLKRVLRDDLAPDISAP
ncbi:MAG: long-chain-fatty-acid--CoA ligase [Thermodesulfobacteriota bacterium]